MTSPTTTPPTLAARVQHVTHRWNGGQTALRDVTLDLPRARITALIGANGAGKTTLLRILAGILHPTEGEVEILGIPNPADPSKAGGAGRRRDRRSRARRHLRRRVAYVSQHPALDPEMTGRETLTLLAACHGVGPRHRRHRVETQARAFGAHTHLDRKVSQHSGGLRRRLHLAGALVHDPDLLLLDEPTAGLDDPGRHALWQELRRRTQAGRTVVIVTHDLQAVEDQADEVAILEAGHLLAAATPGDLVRRTTAPSTLENRRGPATQPVGCGPAAPANSEVTHRPNLATAYRHLTGRRPEELAPPREQRRPRNRLEPGDPEA